jgi:hypothetical protein
MRSCRPLIPTSAVAVTVISLLIAGCGGRSSTAAAPMTQNGVVALVGYSHCMHSHGVPNFPDPNSSGEIPKDKVIPLVSSPQFAVAEKACQHLMPNGSLGPTETAQPTNIRLAHALSFARCMRTHGFPSFPDPTSQGQLTPQMVTAAGIDLHQPNLLSAGLDCVPASHGMLTRSAIERAVHGG